MGGISFKLILISFFLAIAFNEHSAAPEISSNIKEKNCECGAFETDEINSESKPLLAQSPIEVSCNLSGGIICEQMCLNLAKLSKERGPQIICAHLQHADGLKISVFSRYCGNEWKFANITSDPICCHNFKALDCETKHPLA